MLFQIGTARCYAAELLIVSVQSLKPFSSGSRPRKSPTKYSVDPNGECGLRHFVSLGRFVIALDFARHGGGIR
jgi:hypothetical protein